MSRSQRFRRRLWDLKMMTNFARIRLKQVLSYPLFHIRHGRPERIDEMRWLAGEYTFQTENGTVLKFTLDRWRSPRPLLRRWPAPGSAVSDFDYPKPALMMNAAEIRVGSPAKFTDTRGSYLYGPGTWQTSNVEWIELRRTHCARCEKPLLRGWCPRRHRGEMADSASI